MIQKIAGLSAANGHASEPMLKREGGVTCLEVKHVSFNCRHGSETRAGASTRRARRSAYPTGDVTGLFYGLLGVLGRRYALQALSLLALCLLALCLLGVSSTRSPGSLGPGVSRVFCEGVYTMGEDILFKLTRRASNGRASYILRNKGEQGRETAHKKVFVLVKMLFKPAPIIRSAAIRNALLLRLSISKQETPKIYN